MTDPPTLAPNAAMDDHWNGRAGETWVELGRLLDQQLHALGLEAQGALDLQPGERALDIGCGGGETSLDLACAVAPGGAVLGVDISRTLLQRVAEPRVAGLGLDIRFEVADAQTSDFGGERFDAVFSRFGVMFFSDPTAAFIARRDAAREPGPAPSGSGRRRRRPSAPDGRRRQGEDGCGRLDRDRYRFSP